MVSDAENFKDTLMTRRWKTRSQPMTRSRSLTSATRPSSGWTLTSSPRSRSSQTSSFFSLKSHSTPPPGPRLHVGATRPAPPLVPHGQNDSHRSYGRHFGLDGSPGHPMVLMASRVRRKNVTHLTPILNLIKGNILPFYIRGHQHHRMSRRAIGSTVATIGVFELLSWFPNQSGNQIYSSVRRMQSGKPVGAIFSFIQGLINDIFMVLSSLSSISFSVSDPSTRVLLSV